MSPWYFDSSFRTLALVNLAAIVERADEALLPAVYSEIGITFSASPSQLGTLTLIRSLFQALSFPLAAYLALRHDRIHIIASGALVWGIATSAVGFAIHYWQIIIARGINGVGLALVIPAIQSLVADVSEPEKRGEAFGLLSLLGNFGALAGGALAVLFAGQTFFGLDGWRLAFHFIAIISFLLSFSLFFFATEPPLSHEKKSRRSSEWKKSVQEVMTGVRSIIQIKSFQIIIGQGVLGSIPWASLAFTAMWLELIGFSHYSTAFLLACFAVMSSCGAWFGGWFGDRTSVWFGTRGRVACAQFSSGIAVPLTALLLVGIPKKTNSFLSYATVLSFMGFLISWNSASTNNPIFAEIVPENLRTSIYALDRTFEMSFSSFSPPFVGHIAEKYFGFTNLTTYERNNTSLDNVHNADALSYALLFTMTIPFALCCATYTLLYWTYPIDRDNVLEHYPCCLNNEIDGGDGVDNGVGNYSDDNRDSLISSGVHLNEHIPFSNDKDNDL